MTLVYVVIINEKSVWVKGVFTTEQKAIDCAKLHMQQRDKWIEYFSVSTPMPAPKWTSFDKTVRVLEYPLDWTNA